MVTCGGTPIEKIKYWQLIEGQADVRKRKEQKKQRERETVCMQDSNDEAICKMKRLRHNLR